MMFTSFFKPFILIPAAILLGASALWTFPSAKLILMMGLLLSSVVRALASVLAKHRAAYQRGKVAPAIFVRNVLAEMAFLLLVMVLAGVLGSYLARVATGEIRNELMRFVAGTATGLLSGLCVGVAAQHLRGRFIKASVEN